jgi:hypothetical protein
VDIHLHENLHVSIFIHMFKYDYQYIHQYAYYYISANKHSTPNGHSARNVVEGGLGYSWPYIGGWELNARGLTLIYLCMCTCICIFIYEYNQPS